MIPAGVVKLLVNVQGGQGGDPHVGGRGGHGALVTAQIAVSAREQLTVWVGADGEGSGGAGYRRGGAHGKGASHFSYVNDGGGGGGSSAIIGPGGVGVFAGGGGGGGGASAGNGGNGGAAGASARPGQHGTVANGQALPNGGCGACEGQADGTNGGSGEDQPAGGGGGGGGGGGVSLGGEGGGRGDNHSGGGGGGGGAGDSFGGGPGVSRVVVSTRKQGGGGYVHLNGFAPPPPSVPGAPAIGTASAGAGQAIVRFRPPGSNGRRPITGYTVTADDLSNPSHGRQHARGAASPITLRPLTNGDRYRFTVTATNRVGTGPASASSNVVTPTRLGDSYSYVANTYGNTITEYARGATGNTQPTATIVGAHTGLSSPDGVALDATGVLFVANRGNSVTEYAKGATGGVTPVATLAGPSTRLHAPNGLALDPAGDIFVVNNPRYSSPAVTEYAKGARGDTAPVATIQGQATGLNYPQAVALDGSGHIFVANTNGSSVTEYAKGANGNLAPITTIKGSATRLALPQGLAFDLHGDLFVSNSLSTSVMVYHQGATGNAKPTATIGGYSSTYLQLPMGLAFDSDGNLSVANVNGNTITTFAMGATGNAPPVSEIRGDTTGLNGPSAIALTR